MSKLIKKITRTKEINNLEFRTYDHLGENAIVVHDLDCQLERTYRIGAVQELNDFEQVEIVSFDQVIDAWESGSVWF